MDEKQARVQVAIRKVLYGKQTVDKVVQMLKAGNPVQALSATATMVLKVILPKIKAGMTPELSAFMMKTLMSELAELARAAKIKVDDKTIRAATAIMIKGVANLAMRARQPQGMPQQPGMQQPPQQPPQGRGLLAMGGA